MQQIRSFLALAVAFFVAAPAAAEFTMPDPGYFAKTGKNLNFLHVQMNWDTATSAQEYQLQIIVDDETADPFDPMPATAVDALYPGNNGDIFSSKAVVTTGLDWDTKYAWRVRAKVSDTWQAWMTTYRFETEALPADLPAFTAAPTGMGTMESGLTLFNIRSPNQTINYGVALAVEDDGRIVWFLKWPYGDITDIRQIGQDRMLFVADGRAWEVLINGQITWASPIDPDLVIHHEASQMPSGNIMAAAFTFEDVEVEVEPSVFETQTWRGDRFVEINRNNNNVAWDWNTFDYYSLDDFDDTVMQSPTNGPYDPPGGSYDHTHANASVFNQADGSVYISNRHLSRVTRIDKATKNIVYNMGLDSPSMPAGDVDFGDDLFTFQHAPQLLSNGNMMLYDNGNRRGHVDATAGTGVTKALELAFTGNPPTSASIVWSWTLPTYEPAVGDADRLANGNTLVTAGWTGSIYEVDDQGPTNIVWSLSLDGGGMPDYLIYRAERIPYLISNTVVANLDTDLWPNLLDNCPDHINDNQIDRDDDGFGDECARAYGVGAFSLPSISPVGMLILVGLLVAGTFAATRITRRA